MIVNKYVKSYLQALEETLSKKYGISLHKAKNDYSRFICN